MPILEEVSLEGRHPATIEMLAHFSFDHLPEPLKTVSMYSFYLAQSMVRELPDGPELTAGLRKLLEAKDCFVRQAKKIDQEVKDAGKDEGQHGW